MLPDQFCDKYYELQGALHEAANDAKVEGAERATFGPYIHAVSDIRVHLDGCGQCLAHLRTLAGLQGRTDAA